MSGSLNRVTLIGNVGKEPEIRNTQGGKACANFSIATSESWRDKTTGERKEKTEWTSIVVWSEGLVKVIEQYVHKGSRILVEGKLQTRKWQDQSGNDRYTTEVVLNGFDAKLLLLGGKDSNGGSSRSSAASAPEDSGSGYRGGSAGAPDLDDDIPFEMEWR